MNLDQTSLLQVQRHLTEANSEPSARSGPSEEVTAMEALKVEKAGRREAAQAKSAPSEEGETAKTVQSHKNDARGTTAAGKTRAAKSRWCFYLCSGGIENAQACTECLTKQQE